MLDNNNKLIHKKIDDYMKDLGETSLDFYIIDVTNEQNECFTLYLPFGDEEDILSELECNYDYFIENSDYVTAYSRRMCFSNADVETDSASDSEVEIFKLMYESNYYAEYLEELESETLTIDIDHEEEEDYSEEY